MAFDFNAITQASGLINNMYNLQKHEILTVNSLQQVKDFNMNKGDSYLLLDPNADTLYIKECDSIGKIQIRSFALRETTQEVINNASPVTISKSEYNKLIKRLEQLEGNNVSKSESKQSELDFSSK